MYINDLLWPGQTRGRGRDGGREGGREGRVDRNECVCIQIGKM